MGIPVKLEVFEGPLDLLLHLIDKNKVNIYDIPIALITEQYMDYIHKMQERDMDTMSEFLVMATTLLKIKAKLLIPKTKEEEEEEEDPRKELVDRLLEYKMYKYMSYELKERQADASCLFYKKPTIPRDLIYQKEEVKIEELLSHVTLTKLQSIYKSIIKKQVDKIDPIRSSFGKIEREEINMEEKMLFILAYGQAHKTFSFRKLFRGQHSKMDVIVSFLVVLELMKMGKFQIVQETIFDDIQITYRDRGNHVGDKTD